MMLTRLALLCSASCLVLVVLAIGANGEASTSAGGSSVDGSAAIVASAVGNAAPTTDDQQQAKGSTADTNEEVPKPPSLASAAVEGEDHASADGPTTVKESPPKVTPKPEDGIAVNSAASDGAESPYVKKIIAEPPVKPTERQEVEAHSASGSDETPAKLTQPKPASNEAASEEGPEKNESPVEIPRPPKKTTQQRAPVDEAPDDAPEPEQKPKPLAVSPKQAVTVDDHQVDEATYKFVEPPMSLEMKVFQGIMYGFVGAVVITLAYRGLDAAGLDREYFLRLFDGPSKGALIARGIVRGASFVAWIVSTVVMFAFTAMLCCCKKKQPVGTMPTVAPQQPPPSKKGAGGLLKGQNSGGGGGSGKNAEGWNETWSDDDTASRKW